MQCFALDVLSVRFNHWSRLRLEIPILPHRRVPVNIVRGALNTRSGDRRKLGAASGVMASRSPSRAAGVAGRWYGCSRTRSRPTVGPVPAPHGPQILRSARLGP